MRKEAKSDSGMGLSIDWMQMWLGWKDDFENEEEQAQLEMK